MKFLYEVQNLFHPIELEVLCKELQRFFPGEQTISVEEFDNFKFIRITGSAPLTLKQREFLVRHDLQVRLHIER
jgi:hypothetical protein